METTGNETTDTATAAPWAWHELIMQIREEYRQLHKFLCEENETAFIQAARWNRNVFNAYVLEDSEGARLCPGKIHYSWMRHIEMCIKSGKYCAIVAPWGHGKTEQTVIGATLFDLGRNPQLRIKILSNSTENALARLNSVKMIIEQNPRFRAVFPDIVPDHVRGWTKKKLFVKRRGASKDPSVEALGVLAGGTGGRADKLVFDDPVDFRNAILEPKMREMVKDSIRQTWLSRLDTKKKPINYPQVLYIATIWHEEDATYSYVMKNQEFCVLFQAVAEPGMDRIVCRTDGGRLWSVPLWEDKFDKAALQSKRRALQEQTYARGFLNKPFSDSDIKLRSFSRCLDYSLSPQEAMKQYGQNWRILTGVDPSGSRRAGFALFTLAVERDTHLRVPLDIRVGAWSGREPIDQCLEVQKLFNPDVFIVENNAVQDRVRAWIQDAGAGDIMTKPFLSGRNKADPTAGVPGMDIEFANGLWLVALGDVDHRDNPECPCAWCRWLKEVTYYPLYETSDLLMASWFAREEARGGRSFEQMVDGIARAGERDIVLPVSQQMQRAPGDGVQAIRGARARRHGSPDV